MAVAPHELSMLAAIEVMAGGGNAVDGAIAVSAGGLREAVADPRVETALALSC